jgi:hypothetical protein
MLWNTIVNYLQSYFNYPGVDGTIILLCAALALVFGVIWVIGHRPPYIKKPNLWLVTIGSALVTLVLTAFIYIPINYYYTQWLDSTFSAGTLADTILLWCIPLVLIMGLVQEGAKIIPMLFSFAGDVKPHPKMGMMIGAAAGVGFGVFEAFWVYGQTFVAGWSWNLVGMAGVSALIPFWQYFWFIAAHIGISAIVGYGLSKGRGWAYYPLAAILHALLFYISYLFVANVITYNQMAIIIAVLAAIIITISLIMRWRKTDEDVPYLPGQPTIEPPKEENKTGNKSDLI